VLNVSHNNIHSAEGDDSPSLQVGVIAIMNPLSPVIKIHILLTVLHTFLMELVRRICLRQLILGDHFLYSHHWNVWTSNDNVKRNFIFVTVRAERVNRYLYIDYTEGLGVILARVYNIRSLLPTTSIRFLFKIWKLFQVLGIAARSPLFIRKSTHLMSCLSDETLILLETQLLSFRRWQILVNLFSCFDE